VAHTDAAEFARRALGDATFRLEAVAALENRDWSVRTRPRTTAEDGVTVIVPTYRGRDRIVTTLASLAGQTLDSARFEIVVVANGPDDGTTTEVAAFAASHPGLSVRILRAARPSAGAARNVGLAAARRAYLTFLDDDDRLEPDALRAMLERARPDRIVTTRLIDVHPDGRRDESSAMAKRLTDLESRPTGTPLAEATGILGFNACKLIPRDVALRGRYDPELPSGEDVAYMATLLTEQLTVVPAAGDQPRAYLRSVREGSVSRRDADFSFSVDDRLAVIRRLERIDAHPDNSNGLSQLIRAQARFLARFVEDAPQQWDAVQQAIADSGVTQFPWHVFKNREAGHLAILYCFSPFLDPSGVAAGKVIAAREKVVDVITADMSDIRAKDYSLDALNREWLARRAIIPTEPYAFSSWAPTADFAVKAAERAHAWEKTRGVRYETLYTRALWCGSHVAGAIYKLSHPDVVWTAEFSDPLSRGIDALPRPSYMSEDEVTAQLRAAVHKRGTVIPEGISMFEFVEYVTYALADEFIFTNPNQRDYMLSLTTPELAERVGGRATVRPHPSPSPSAYQEVITRYTLRDDVVNIGYFGSFYGNRTLSEVLLALRGLTRAERDRIRLHVFCNKPEEFTELLTEHGLATEVYVNPYLGYMEFLNASTKFDVLLVQDADTTGTFEVNPFLPSKYSDYRGSGAAVWGIIEEGSPLSAQPLSHRSGVGDVEGAIMVLRTLAGS